MQRLTDKWQGLLGNAPQNEASQEREREESERDEHLADEYRNMYWTRVISVGSGEGEAAARWAIVDDVIAALQEIR